jgi:hypothetical protein
MQIEGRSVSDINLVHSWLLPSYSFLISYHAVTQIMPPQPTRRGGPHQSENPNARVLIFVVD